MDGFASLAMTGRAIRATIDESKSKAPALMKQPCVYMVASGRNGTLYTGVTSDLNRRAYEHRSGAIEGFTKRYSCKRLVWYERYERMDEAIAREKQIKGGGRAKKIALIQAINPDWRDLYEVLND
jgi:predicted GIY-YIG superfamily endonuclease